jgi:riboflavin kinase/FMN adenylyltransferase
MSTNSNQALPPDGVYATWAHINGETYQSVMNIGKRPTFGGSERIIEVFLFDYDDDLYGRELKIGLVERIRGEKKFDKVEELQEQVKEDIKRTRAILDSREKGRNE